jgi:hypothetical protein
MKNRKGNDMSNRSKRRAKRMRQHSNARPSFSEKSMHFDANINSFFHTVASMASLMFSRGRK